MQSRISDLESVRLIPVAAGEAEVVGLDGALTLSHELLDSETERAARERLFDEVLASVELVLVADGAAFWREAPDHSLVLTASRSIAPEVLDAFDRQVTTPLQSIMQRWPESPLVAVPLNDPTNPIAEETRQITDREGIVGLAGPEAAHDLESGPLERRASGRERGAKEARISQNIIVVPLRVHGEVVGSLNLTRVGGPEATSPSTSSN